MARNTNRAPQPPKKVKPQAATSGPGAEPPAPAPAAEAAEDSWSYMRQVACAALEEAGVDTSIAPDDVTRTIHQTAAHAPGTDWRHIARAIGADNLLADQRRAIRLVIGVAEAMLDR